MITTTRRLIRTVVANLLILILVEINRLDTSHKDSSSQPGLDVQIKEIYESFASRALHLVRPELRRHYQQLQDYTGGRRPVREMRLLLQLQ